MDAAPALPPPTIEQPAPYQVSFGLVTGVAGRGARRVEVSVDGRVLTSRALRGRRFTLRVQLPVRDVAVRVTTLGPRGSKSSRLVRNVYGLPRAARPRFGPAARTDAVLQRQVETLVKKHRGTAGVYVQSLTTGFGGAWNAKARFPAASTVKLAIAAAVLADYSGIPPPRSRLQRLLRKMIVPSDDEAANILLVWLGGSTSGGGYRVSRLMRSLGMRDTIMYGGYLVRKPASAIPIRVEEQPAFGIGKHTTAWDLATLHRSIWLAAGNKGPLRRTRPGFTAADGRHLLWLLAHVRDEPKLDRTIGKRPGVAVLHKAGWVSTARHDAGLVFWRGGVFVVSVMTWRASGARRASDRLAGRCAELALDRFARRSG